jgi:hypothetical protein
MAFTEAPARRFKMHFVDDVGKPASVQVFVATSESDPAGGGCATLAAAAAACSADALVSQELIISGLNDSPGSPTDGPYARGADKLKLWIRASSGQDVSLEIGSPQESVLAAGKVNVDPTNTAITNLIGGLITYGCDASGDSLKALQRGYRMRPSRRRHQ